MSDSMRSLNSFGVAGLIAENAEVFYTNDLRARNAGRVADLIAAQVRDLDIDELRIRSLLTYGLFQTYAVRGLPNRHDEGVDSASLEVGVDSAYVAVAIAFHWDREQTPKWEGLSERVMNGSPADEFEKILVFIQLHSTQVLVRYDPKERRLEIVSLLNRNEAALKDPLETILIEVERSPLLEVANYRELGDLNYADALRSPVNTVVTGEVPAEDESEQRFIGSEPEADATPILVKQPEEPAKDDWGLQFLKQVWPFASSPESAVVVNDAVEVIPSAIVVSGDSNSDIESIEVTTVGASLPAQVSETIVVSDSTRLKELEKEFAAKIRQKDAEIKTSQRAIRLELKQATDLLRQRESMLENKIEQIAQLNVAVERATHASNDKEQKEMKVRLDRAQMLAQVKEEEAKTLVSKVRDLENRLIIAQAKAQKGNDLELQTNVQALEKKVEEYKRINQRLMESMNQQKDKSTDKEVSDLKRKIEQLDRITTESKRALDKASFRIREVQESEKKLQTDLARAVEENRSLRKSQGRGNGESGGQAA